MLGYSMSKNIFSRLAMKDRMSEVKEEAKKKAKENGTWDPKEIKIKKKKNEKRSQHQNRYKIEVKYTVI